MSKIEVKIATVDDLHDVARLFEASIRDHAQKAGLELREGFDWSQETLLRIQRPSSRYILGYVDRRAVGIQAVQLGAVGKKKSLLFRLQRRLQRAGPTSPFRVARRGLLTDIWVEEAYRKQGIGRVLVRASIDLLVELGYERVELEILATNEPMHSLAASLGFLPTTLKRVLEAR